MLLSFNLLRQDSPQPHLGGIVVKGEGEAKVRALEHRVAGKHHFQLQESPFCFVRPLHMVQLTLFGEV